jgi:hypothetical protein
MKLKNILTSLICTIALVLSTSAVRAQDAPSTTATTTNSSTIDNLLGTLNIGDAAQKLFNEAQSGGLFTATNYAIEPYLTYAPKAPAGNTVGCGILAVHNVNSMVGIALGVDYLGQFSLVSGNATLKYPINVGSKVDKYVPSVAVGLKPYLDEIVVVPFVLGGVGKPFSGSSSSATLIYDVGGYIQYGHLLGGKFNTGLCWGGWDNAGAYSGKRYHIFAGWSHGF